ncbi:hypothetical protein JZ751_003689 [Albula glossodonta]|uniref:Uncharacterized protein n=1 Tax=Albula glossodonta TaxID=121402 RepID=A0A8T2NH56_9TELE|nr:hypothetical protein JZ751_003689 [Albula glossodonta]
MQHLVCSNPSELWSGWRFGGLGHAHIVLGIDAEVVLPPGHDVAHGAFVVEEAVGHRAPGLLAGVALGHQVVEMIVPLLVGGRLPVHRDRPADVLLQLHWARGLGVI